MPCFPRAGQRLISQNDMQNHAKIYLTLCCFFTFISGPVLAAVPLTQLENFQNAEVDALVDVRALVTAPFGLIKSNNLYALPLSTSTSTLFSTPIYLSSKIKPKFSAGALVRIRGTIAVIRGEKVVKISEPKALELLGMQDLPHPEAISAQNVTDAYEDAWISIQGRILKINSKSFSVGDETVRVLVYGTLPRPAPAKKALVRATGLLQYKGANPTLTVVRPDNFSVISETSTTSPTSTAPILNTTTQTGASMRWWYIATVPIAAGAGWLIKRFVVEKI